MTGPHRNEGTTGGRPRPSAGSCVERAVGRSCRGSVVPGLLVVFTHRQEAVLVDTLLEAAATG